MEIQQQFDKRWSEIKPVILNILYQGPINQHQWHDLFSKVYCLCLLDQYGIKKIEDDLQNIIIEFVQKVQRILSVHQEDQALLKAYISELRTFFQVCEIFPYPFKYFEKTLYGNQNSDHKSILKKFMLDKWNQYIFHNIRERLQDAAMNLVYFERIGEAFYSQLVIELKESFRNLYEDDENSFLMYQEYEKLYIQETESFYKIKASEYFEGHGVLKYMQYAENKIRDEDTRAHRYLEKSSAKLLSEHCAYILVSSFDSSILDEFTNIIKSNDIKMLSLSYKLINYIPYGISKMMKIFENFILSEGLAVMNASAEIITQNSEKYVEQLLLLFGKFSSMIHQAFDNNPRFLTLRDKAYQHIVNDTTVFRLILATKQNSSKYPPESKSPELLANYCDMLLRKTSYSKKLTSDEIENKLKDLLLILKYVENKDVFMRFHVAHLTRRLLLNTSADFCKEENMIISLREIGMPAEYINKLQMMFQDIKVSEDLNKQFKCVCRITKGKFADSINIKILNMGSWLRSREHTPVTLPLELEEIIPEIESFYGMNHSGRKIHWYHHMSNGTIIFTNDIGQFEIDVTTFQMVIFFVWNGRPKDKISFESLRLATGLSNAELKRTLLTLVAFPKLKKQILKASCSPNEFNDSTTFWINDEFCLFKYGKPQKRGKLNIIGRLQLSTENSESEESKYILQLRVLRVQEATIKIMKMHKSISNTDLHIELVNMLKNMFLPSKEIIKEQIDWLIEKQYMERDKDDMNKFVYIA